MAGLSQLEFIHCTALDSVALDNWAAHGHAGENLLPQFKIVTLKLCVTAGLVNAVFSAADDPTYHVSAVCLGSVQQGHHCILLVWNEI